MMRLARWGALLGRLSRRRSADLRGLQGSLNIEFTGEDGGGWHVRFDEGRVDVREGLDPQARATVRLRCEDYLALLAGDLSLSVARLTGRLRVSGDGNFGMLFGAMIGSLQNEQRAPGIRGWVARRIVARALRRGGYVPQRKRAGKRAPGEDVT